MSELSGGLASTANATPAAPSAPSTPSAPASQPASSSISLSDAFQQAGVGEEAASAATEIQPEATAPAPATVEPPAPDPSAEVEAAGPIPLDRHKAVLESTRKKAAEEAIAQFQQQHGEAITFATAFNADPVGTAVHLIQQLQAHPEYGQALRSHAGRMLAAQRQRQPQPQAQAEPEPAPDLIGRDANGQEVSFYSAQQAAKRDAWREKQFEQRFAERFAPLNELQQQVQQFRQREQETQDYLKRSSPLVEELKEMPGFNDYKQEIGARQAELFKQSPNTDPVKLWFRAYREIVPGKLQHKQTQELATSALAKAAGRDANPAVVNGSAPPGPGAPFRDHLAALGLR
jgi:hypothetical protein